MKELEEAIKNGAESEIVKPKIVRASDLNMISPAWPDLMTLKEKDWINKINGVGFENGKLVLYPVEPDTRLYDFEYGQLYHKGLLFINGNCDNLTNLKERGVFGSPEKNMTTYLMKCGVNIKTFNNKNGNKKIRLFIDKEKLMKRRSVFIDPETITDNYFHEKIGDSYFILGGIPRESITEFVLDD